MDSAIADTPTGTIGRRRLWLGAGLLVLGLLGHLVSAYHIRTNPLAFPDHIKGFVFIAVVTGIVVAGAGWLFWRGRRDITWTVWCAVQAVLGAVVLGVTWNGFH